MDERNQIATHNDTEIKTESGSGRKYEWATWCVLGFLFLFACMIYVYEKTVSYNNGAYIDIYGDLKARKTATEFLQIEDGTTIETEFTTDVEMIRTIAFQFRYEENITPNGTVEISLYNAQTGEVISNRSYSALEMSDTTYSNFGFDPPLVNDCKSYKVVVTFGGLEGQNISMYMDNGRPYLSVISAGKDNFFHMEVVCYILVLSLIGISMVCLYSKRISVKVKLEHVYVIAGITLGIVYSLILPVATVPDEPDHMNNAYLISNHILGIPDSEDGTIKMRVSEAENYLQRIDLDREFFNATYEGLFDPVRDATIVDTEEETLNAPFFLYIPSAIGITLGRLLGRKIILMYMIGRLFNTFFFVWAVYYSMKKLPFGKCVLFVWALIPMTLQQANSFSYDSPIMALCTIITALTLRFLYDDTKAKKTEIAIYILALLLLFPCKGHAFLPMVMFPIALIPAYIKKHKSSVDAFKEKHPWWKKALIATIIGISVVFVAGLIIAVRYVTAPEHMNNTFVKWAQYEGYSVGYLIENPSVLVSVLLTTGFANGESYLLQMLGSFLGWLEVHVSVLFLFPYVILLIFAAMRKESEPQPIGVGTKIYMWLIYISICGLTVAAMLIYWTPRISGVINGIQGRYLLPALPVAMLACRTRRACLGNDSDKHIALTAIYLQVFIITSFFMNF